MIKRFTPYGDCSRSRNYYAPLLAVAGAVLAAEMPEVARGAAYIGQASYVINVQTTGYSGATGTQTYGGMAFINGLPLYNYDGSAVFTVQTSDTDGNGYNYPYFQNSSGRTALNSAPASNSPTAIATNGTAVVGYTINSASYQTQAQYWTTPSSTMGSYSFAGTNNVASEALAVSPSGLVVGEGSNTSSYAETPLYWSGSTAGTALSTSGLSAYSYFVPTATDGTAVAGTMDGTYQNGVYWPSVGSTSPVNLGYNPLGKSGTTFSESVFGVSGTVVVGDEYTGTDTAMLLHVSGSTVTDVPLTLTGFNSSTAMATNGTIAVGYGVYSTTGDDHALEWSSTGVLTDLNSISIPGYTFVDTFATSVDALGDVYGYGVTSGGINVAVEWAVPEPATVSLMAFGIAGLALRRRRRVRLN